MLCTHTLAQDQIYLRSHNYTEEDLTSTQLQRKQDQAWAEAHWPIYKCFTIVNYSCWGVLGNSQLTMTLELQFRIVQHLWESPLISFLTEETFMTNGKNVSTKKKNCEVFESTNCKKFNKNSGHEKKFFVYIIQILISRERKIICIQQVIWSPT